MENIILKLIGLVINLGSIIAPKFTADKGYELFSAPKRLTLKPEQLSFFNSAENIDVPYENEKIRVYKWGSGATKILFCHGWQSHSYRWFPYVEKLDKNKYTIYAMDAPASGQSTGKLLNMPYFRMNIENVVDQLGPFDFYVGHSLGAFSILFAIHERPDFTAKGIISMASPGNAIDFVQTYLDKMNLSSRAYKLIEDKFIGLFGRNPNDYVTAEFAKTLQIPGLIVHDVGDKETPYHYAKDLNKSWKGSQLETIEGAGHRLRADEVIEKVVGYIDQNSGNNL